MRNRPCVCKVFLYIENGKLNKWRDYLCTYSLGTFLPAAVWIGWIPDHAGSVFICVGSFIIVYFIIWFAITLYWKRKVEGLNKKEHIK
jgi:hypothetical protein